jgi:hypothetical protein
VERKRNGGCLGRQGCETRNADEDLKGKRNMEATDGGELEDGDWVKVRTEI